MTTSLIIGASKGLGRSLSLALSRINNKIILCSRNISELKKLKAIIEKKSNCKVLIVKIDLNNLNLEKFVNQILKKTKQIDNFLLISGISSISISGPTEEKKIKEIINVNFYSFLKIINLFLKLKINFKNIVMASSVACSRARANNSLYASAKLALEFYLQSIQHYLGDEKIKIQIYRLGYMDTDMTKGQKTLLPKVKTSSVAEKIIKNLDKKFGIIYLPFWWYFIKLLFSNLPWIIFKRMKL